MKRDIPPTLAVLLLLAVVASGCAPLGSKFGREQVVAQRNHPHGLVAEQIIGVPTEHLWMMLVAPHGPEMNTVLSETWRFYLVGADGRREPLHFLKRRGGNVVPERVEHGHYDYHLICFTANGITLEKALDYPEYGEFHFDSESHILTHKTKGETRSYDPLANVGFH